MVLNGRVSGIAAAISAARYSEMFAKLTISAVLIVKLIILVLAFFGLTTLWFAIFIDSAAALGAILCSILVFNSDPNSGGIAKLFRR
jgi:cation transport ATPase